MFSSSRFLSLQGSAMILPACPHYYRTACGLYPKTYKYESFPTPEAWISASRFLCCERIAIDVSDGDRLCAREEEVAIVVLEVKEEEEEEEEEEEDDDGGGIIGGDVGGGGGGRADCLQDD